MAEERGTLPGACPGERRADGSLREEWLWAGDSGCGGVTLRSADQGALLNTSLFFFFDRDGQEYLV